MASFPTILGSVPDPRSGNAQRHGLLDMLVIALGGVFIQASHAIAHASATKPVKEAMVFSQRRAMRRKRLI
jgi:hypothetical protein